MILTNRRRSYLYCFSFLYCFRPSSETPLAKNRIRSTYLFFRFVSVEGLPVKPKYLERVKFVITFLKKFTIFAVRCSRLLSILFCPPPCFSNPSIPSPANSLQLGTCPNYNSLGFCHCCYFLFYFLIRPSSPAFIRIYSLTYCFFYFPSLYIFFICLLAPRCVSLFCSF